MGEFESLNFSIGVLPEDIALFHGLYRSSIKGRKDLISMMFADETDGIKEIDKSYTSRVAEIFNVTLKSMGIELDFVDEDNIITSLNNSDITEHKLNGATYMCTDYQFFLLKRMAEVRQHILEENPVLTTEKLDEMVEKALKSNKYLMGELNENLDDLVLNVEAEDKAVYEKLRDRKIQEELMQVEESMKEVNIEDVLDDDE